jgi:hypothetical protein
VPLKHKKANGSLTNVGKKGGVVSKIYLGAMYCIGPGVCKNQKNRRCGGFRRRQNKAIPMRKLTWQWQWRASRNAETEFSNQHLSHPTHLVNWISDSGEEEVRLHHKAKS